MKINGKHEEYNAKSMKTIENQMEINENLEEFAGPTASGVADLWLRSSSPSSPVVRSFLNLIH